MGTSGSAPSARAEELAGQFEQLNGEVIAFVESCDDATWTGSCADDGRSVGAVAHHVAGAHRAVGQWVSMIAAGQPVNVTMDEIHASNARAAAADAHKSRQEVVDALRRHGATAAASVRALDDDGLARSAAFGPAGGTLVSAETVIVSAMLGHPRGHLESMRKGAAGE